MQRLYLQFYVTILLVLAIFVGAAVLTWQLAEEQTPQYLDVAAELTGALLPDYRGARRPTTGKRLDVAATANCKLRPGALSPRAAA